MMFATFCRLLKFSTVNLIFKFAYFIVFVFLFCVIYSFFSVTTAETNITVKTNTKYSEDRSTINQSIATQAVTDTDPLSMLQMMASNMINSLQKNKSQLKTNPGFVVNLARTILLPHIDNVRMSQMVLGREAWNNATKTEKQDFINLFTDIVIKTYAKAFANYDNQTVSFLPLRDKNKMGSFLTIDSLINRSNASPIQVSYQLMKLNNVWKISDILVGNVSMFESFRSQFSEQLDNPAIGMRGLINKLKKINEA